MHTIHLFLWFAYVLLVRNQGTLLVRYPDFSRRFYVPPHCFVTHQQRGKEQCDLRFVQTGDVNNFLQSCMHIVNRCFALRLSEVPWTRILNATPDVDGANHISNVIVSRSHCQPDPSTRKVIERLLRFKLADQNKPILSKDIFQAFVGILQQPGAQSFKLLRCVEGEVLQYVVAR